MRSGSQADEMGREGDRLVVSVDRLMVKCNVYTQVEAFGFRCRMPCAT